MSVRRVSSRGGNVVGRFPSLKTGHMVQFESLIELDYIYLLDYEPEVEWFEEQPLTIEYRYRGKALHYTPDFRVVRSGQNWLVECKPDKFVDTEKNQRKFAAATIWCTERGWTFEIVTADHIRSGYRLRNVKFLTQYARHTVDPITRSHVYTKVLDAISPITLIDLAKHIEPLNLPAGLATIFHLVFHHELAIALEDAPISLTSAVVFPQKTGERR